MLTRAFVLCSDEKALDAVSHVLSELEITFEQFHDIAFAAKRLTVQAFDLLVIDCDQQDDAARLLDSVRSSDLNRGAMTVAVVDGKAGVPIAFRLGAELVIPKPVSLEQARSTLRTAVAMYRKTHPEAKPLLRPAPVAPQPVNPSKPKATIAFPEPKISAPAPQPASLAPPLSSPKKVELPTKPAGNTDVSVPAMRGLSLSMPSASLKNTDATLELNSELSPKPAAEKQGYPLPAEAFEDKSRKRTVSSGLVAALVLAMIGIAGYEAYTMVPQFRTTVDANYQLLRSQIPGATPPVAAVAAKPIRPAVKPAPAVPPDGFVASADPVESSAATAATTIKTAKPVLLATTATTTTVEDPAPINVPGDLADQHVSARVDPVYPESLRRKGVHGDVVLQALIRKDGSVDSVSVVSGNPQLAAAALDAVKQWKYETYIHNGAPADFQTNVTIAFEPAPKSTH